MHFCPICLFSAGVMCCHACYSNMWLDYELNYSLSSYTSSGLPTHTHPLQRIHVDLCVKELIVVVVVQLPLLHNLIDVRGVADKACKIVPQSLRHSIKERVRKDKSELWSEVLAVSICQLFCHKNASVPKQIWCCARRNLCKVPAAVTQHNDSV